MPCRSNHTVIALESNTDARCDLDIDAGAGLVGEAGIQRAVELNATTDVRTAEEDLPERHHLRERVRRNSRTAHERVHANVAIRSPEILAREGSALTVLALPVAPAH